MHLEAMLKRNLTHAHNSKVLIFFVHAHKNVLNLFPMMTTMMVKKKMKK